MVKRKKKLIDIKYQLKGAVYAIGISVAAFIVVLAVLGTMIYLNNKVILSTIDKLDTAVETEEKIVESFKTYTNRVKILGVRIGVTNVVNDHKKSMKVVHDFSEMIKRTAQHNYYLFWVILVVVIVQAITLFIYMIRHTHTMAGPAFVIERYLDRILNDEDPDFRPLREGDSMTEIQEKLELLYKTKVRKKRKKKEDPESPEKKKDSKSPRK